MLTKKVLIGTMCAVLMGFGLASPVFGSSTSHTIQPKLSGSPIAIGFETSLTGGSSEGRADGVASAQAAVDWTNAHGGINGHPVKLDVADDTSTAAGALTATQTLVSEGVVGITDPAGTFAGAAQQYADAQGVPWTAQCNSTPLTGDSNIYCDNVTTGTGEPVPTIVPKLLESLHITTIGGIAPGSGVVSSGPAATVVNTLLAAKQCCNITTSILDVSPSSTSTDFTSDALAIKNANPGAVFIAFLATQQVLIAQALKQQGYNGVIVMNTSSFEQAYAATPSFYGVYQQDWYRPPSSTFPAGSTFQPALKKYAHNEYGGYAEAAAFVGTYLLISGLQKVKGTATGPKLAAALSTIKSYDGDGLLPQTINYTVPNRNRNSRNIQKCFWVDKDVNGKFKNAISGKPICGPLEGLPGQ